MEDLDDLIEHLARSSRLSPSEAQRIVAEVLEFFSESPEAYIARRHKQLKDRQMANPAIFERITRELSARRFAAPELSLRQIRRIIYG